MFYTNVSNYCAGQSIRSIFDTMVEEKAMRIATNISATDVPTYLKTATTMMLVPVDHYIQDITEIKQMLRALMDAKTNVIEKSDLIEIKEASSMLKISKSTIYKLTAQNKIPFQKRKGSNRLSFSRNSLSAWMQNPQMSAVNLVDEYLCRNVRSERA